jgi:hypothetical protein
MFLFWNVKKLSSIIVWKLDCIDQFERREEKRRDLGILRDAF